MSDAEKKTKIELKMSTANTLKSLMKVGDSYDSVIQRLFDAAKIKR